MSRHSKTLSKVTAFVSSFAVALGPTSAAFADVVALTGPDGMGTQVITSGTVSDVISGTTRNGVAFNSFSQFNVGQSNTVNLYQPSGTNALVNVILSPGGAPSMIDGTLNTRVGAPDAYADGGRVFMVDPNGFVVSGTGIINAGQLTMSTATQDFARQIIAEGNGGDTDAVATLFAGNEPLSAADIEVYGRINASRLDLRAGARMVLNGQLNIIDNAASGRQSVANMSDIQQAAGVSTEGGVLRFTAGSNPRSSGSNASSIGGTITARRGTDGGTAVGFIDEGSPDTSIGGTVDLNGANGGSFLLFTESSALLQPAVQIRANGTTGTGGFVYVRSNAEGGSIDIAAGTVTAPTIRLQGTVGTFGGAGNGTSVFEGETIQIAGNLFTSGGNLGLIAEKGIVQEGVAVNSMNAAINRGGDILYSAPIIIAKQGALIVASAPGLPNAGLVALVARAESDSTSWNINPDNRQTALVRLDSTTIRAGAVVISATAINSNVVDSSASGEEADVSAYTNQQSAVEAQLTGFVDTVEGLVSETLTGAVDTLKVKLPVQVQVMTADARVEITNSSIITDASWSGRTATVATDFTGDAEARGVFSADGLLEGELTLFGVTGPERKVVLPTAFDPSSDSVFIQSHAKTDVQIAPKAFLLGVGVAVTNTDSRVVISGAQNRIEAVAATGRPSGVKIRSTATENLNIAIAPSQIAGISVGVIVAVHSLRNQALVRDGVVIAGGALEISALTSKAHSLSVTSNGGKDGKGAVALNVDVGNSITEAAAGGTLRSGGVFGLNAETLYFEKSHATSSTLGLADPLKTAINGLPVISTLKSKVTEVTNKIKETISGKKDDAKVKKPGFAFGLSFDLQLDDDDTYATLGGIYRDLTSERAPVQLGLTEVTATGGLVVNAALRFATPDEGGSEISRSVDSSMGFLDRLAEAELNRLNQALVEAGLEPVTKEDLFGQFGYAVFLNASIALMQGETIAEIGSNARITATRSVDVDASTVYPEFARFTEVRDDFLDFINEASEFKLVEGSVGEGVEVNAPPALPNVLGYLDLSNYLTTYAGAYAEQNQLENEGANSQNLAVAISVNAFNTDNATRAVIRDGAILTDQGHASTVDSTLTVTAEQVGFFTHMQNFPTDIRIVTDPIGSNDNLRNLIGGAVTVARTKSLVEAIVEGNANLAMDAVTLDAHNRAVVFNFVYAGGAAENIAINAAIGAQAVENTTVARLSDLAMVTAKSVNIKALDDSIVIGVAGAFAGSDGSVSVGASGTVNFVKREVYAGIGPSLAGSALSGTPAQTRITAQTLTIEALNEALTIGTAVAGSRVSGKPAQPPGGGGGTPPEEENTEDTLIPSWLFNQDENDALTAQNTKQTPAGSDGSKQSSGWAVAGAATVNLMLRNTTTAEVATNATIDLTGDFKLKASNLSRAITGAGAVSVGLGSTQKNNALAGSFAITVDERDVLALVRGVTLRARTIDIDAEDKSLVVSVAVGGAGSKNGKVTLAGSFAASALTGETRTRVQSASLSAEEDLTIDAKDESLAVSVGGAVSVNLSQSEGAGVGVGVAVNVQDRGVRTEVLGATTLDAEKIALGAESGVRIYGFGVSVGVGKTGVAGSIAVNTITGGAKLAVGQTATPITIKTAKFDATVTEANKIWSLAGALTGGRTTAVGGALTANVIVTRSGAEITNVDISRRDLPAGWVGGDPEPQLGAVKITSDATSNIETLAAAGAAALEGNAIGVGLSGNTIDAQLTALLEDSSVTDAASVELSASNKRVIRSLGGGIAGSGKGAGGFAATVNILNSNLTQSSLNGSTLTVGLGGVKAEAVADGRIETIAAAVTASGQSSIGGAATVNVSTGLTEVSADGADVTTDGAIRLSASDTQTIRSLSGGVALSAGGTGVGGALSANVITNRTITSTQDASLATKGQDIDLLARNQSTIESLAVGFGATAGNTAVSGSIAIGYIGNETTVTAVNTALKAGNEATVTDPETRGKISLQADKDSKINILSGAAAVSSSTAVGGALSVAVILDSVSADMVASGDIYGANLAVEARGSSAIDAIAVSGAASGNVAAAPSLVYTQIGVKGAATPEVPATSRPANPEDGEDDPATSGRNEVLAAQSASLTSLTTRTGVAATVPTIGGTTGARLALSGGTTDVTGITVSATERAGDADNPGIRSLAGGIAGSGTAGVGAGVALNLILGRTEAILELGEGANVSTGGTGLSVLADQQGRIETLGFAGGGAGTFGGAGSIVVNIMDRTTSARIRATDSDQSGSVTAATLTTLGGDVTLRATQSGSVKALGGAAGIGGVAGVGGAFAVTVLSDDVEALIDNVTLDTASSTGQVDRPLLDAGALTLAAQRTTDIETLVIAAAVGGKGAFGGSFAINVAEGSVTAALRNATVRASSLDISAITEGDMTARAGVLAGSGFASAGLGIATNVSRVGVTVDLASALVRADGNVKLLARAETGFTGFAMGAAASGGVSFTGTAFANRALNTVRVTVRDAGGRPANAATVPTDVLARGSVLVSARSLTTSRFGTSADTDELADDFVPDINLNFSVGSAGIGAAVSVNDFSNTAEVEINGQSSVVGLGQSGIVGAAIADGTRTFNGVAIDAFARSRANSLTVTAAAGGTALSGVFGFAILSDTARVRLGDGTTAGAGQVNVNSSEEIGFTTANAAQESILSAQTESLIRTFNVAATISTSLSVGAAAGTNISGSQSEIILDFSAVRAARNIDLNTKSRTDLENWVVSAAGGYFSAAGAVAVNVVNSASRIDLRGSTLVADGALRIRSDIDNRLRARVGGLGAANIALAGGLIVNVLQSTSEVRTSSLTYIEQDAVATTTAVTSLLGLTGVTIDAATNNTTDLVAVSAGLGFSGAIAIAANVNVVKTTTRVAIGSRSTIVAGVDPDAPVRGLLIMRATEITDLTGRSGSLGAAAGLGVGATLDVASFAATSSVAVGESAVLRATQGVLMNASADRQVSSSVAALSAGIGGISGAVSVVDMGGRTDTSAERRDELLAQVQTALGDDQSGSVDSSRGSAAEVASFAGGGSARNSAVAVRQGVNVTGAPGTDQIGVLVGENALISGDLGIEMQSRAQLGVTQRVGALAVGGIGLTAAVATATVSTASEIRIGRNSRLLSDGSIELLALVAGRDNQIAVDSEVAALAASTGASINAGVSVVRLNSTSRTALGEGVAIGGIRSVNSNLVTLRAGRIDTATARVRGAAVSGVAGIGAAVADAQSTGLTSVVIGGAADDTRIDAFGFLASAIDNSSVSATAEGVAGGIVAGNGSVATARNAGRSEIMSERLILSARSIRLSNISTAVANANARGVSVGALAVGASVATSSLASTLVTSVKGGTLAGATILIQTELRKTGSFNVQAQAESSSGALVAGNGSDARTFMDHDLTVAFDGATVAADDMTVQANASQAAAKATATGRVFGLAAVGATLASSGQSAGQTSTVRAIVEGGTFAIRRNLTIASVNGASYAAEVTSGQGGLVTGAGGATTVATRSNTITRIGAANRTTAISSGLVDLAGRMDISAAGNTTVGSTIDNTSGALIGASGARSTTTVDDTVQTLFAGDMMLLAPNLDLRAATTVTRPTGEYNVKSASGGVIDVAAIVSTVTVNAVTNLNIGNGVKVIQSGSKANPGDFLVGITTNMKVADKLRLDAGGAVAVPVGDSTVTVGRNDAILSVGSALIQGLGEVVLYNGGNANVLSDVNSNSYGLAGAATSIARATYNARNEIRLGAGSLVTSLEDVRLVAGGFRSGVQSVVTRSEARAYNKTAFPINVPPVADAKADTVSRIQIDAGARVTSVRDIYLLSEAGSRSIVGYGRGKDLYREVLAEIGSAISQAFGGDPVSLDIETGSATDLSDDGIIVNGSVRSGDRSQQVLILDERNVNGIRTYVNVNESEGFSIDLARDITFTALLNVQPAQDLQDRINVLNSYLSNTALVTADPAARTAWEAERDTLILRQAALGAVSVDEIRVGPITAAEGNIIMRADWVEGAATGELYAPGEARVTLWVKNGAWLRTSDIEIVNREGGRISLNDVSVSTAADLQRLSKFRVAPYALSVVADDKDTEPKIEIVTFTPDLLAGGTPRGDGTIILNGDVVNLRGTALVNSNEGSVDIRGDVSARTIDISAQNDVVIGYVPGVRNVGGDPVGQYADYFAANQNSMRFWLQLFGNNPQTYQVGSNGFLGPVLPAFNIAQATTGLRAGRNVYISADTLNVNGLIQAGTGNFEVTLLASLETELEALRQAGGTGRRLLFDTAFPARSDFTNAGGISANTNVKVYYNFETNQVEIADMFVRGGEVVITGNLISTGAGRIEALDGFGRIKIVSGITTDLVLKRIDLGAESDGSSGLEGLVRITDTAKSYVLNGVRVPLVTEFRRSGSVMRVFDNVNGAESTQTVVIGTNPDGSDRTISVVRPTRLVGEFTDNDGRSASYAPLADRDLIIVTAEQTTTTIQRRREELIIIGITGSKTDKVVNVTVNTTATTESLGIAPYVGASRPESDYGYLVTGLSVRSSFTRTDDVKTHDSVRWWKVGSGWRHFEWTETVVTNQYYQHRLKADYAIEVFFNGFDSPDIDISSVGNVIFSNTVLNQLGKTSVTSAAGSILTASPDVVLTTGNLSLEAAQDIRGATGELRIDQTATSQLSLVAGNRIDVREINGDMRLAAAETIQRPGSAETAKAGSIRLVAKNNLIQINDSRVIGSNIALRAEDGSIGTEATPFRIDTQNGNLTAYAGQNVTVEEMTGDLGLVEVRAVAGNATVIANDGSILDRNNVERRDIRTLEELRTLWTGDLGLNGAKVAERRATEIARIETERTGLYHAYWRQRGTGTSATYVIDPDLQAALLRDTVLTDGTVIPGWTQARIDAYVAERQALFDQWNAEATYDTTRVITLSPAEIAALEQPGGALEGLVWTDRELTRALRSDLVRRTSDTTIRVEDPNVIAQGDIILRAKGRVGEELPDQVIASGAELTETDLAVLFSAERDDITIGADSTLRIRRAEDVNFLFTSINAQGNATGALRVISAESEIFIGSESAAALAEVVGSGRVTIRTDGNITDVSSGVPATISGGILVLEAGTRGGIGAADRPLTVAVAPAGNLTARAENGIFITAPAGDLPLREVFARGRVALRAPNGAILDVVGTDVARVIATSVLLSGQSVGTAAASVGVETSDPLGTLAVTATSGNAFVKGFTALRLESARIARGGSLVMAKGRLLSLVGADTIIFGADSTFVQVTPSGIDVAGSTGTDIAGGRLEVTTGGAYGSPSKRLVSTITTLDYRSDDLGSPIANPTANTALWLQDDGDLRIDNLVMNLSAISVTDVIVTRDLSLGLAQSIASARFEVGRDMTEGRIIAERADLLAGRDLGGTSQRIDITAGALMANAVAGSTYLLLRDRDITINSISTGPTGKLVDVVAQTAAIDLQSGGIFGATGVRMRVEDAILRGSVLSATGDVDALFDGDLETTDGIKVETQPGTVRFVVTGDAAFGDANSIVTGNATDAALYLGVAGELSVGAQPKVLLNANAAGALTTLRIGSIRNTGPTGVRVDLDRIDSIVANGDTHLREDSGITVEQIISSNGNVDLYTKGDTVLKRVTASGGTVVIGSGGSLTGDAVRVDGRLLKLFAFGGRLGGMAEADAMRVDTESNAEVWLLARDRLALTEFAGDLRVAAAISQLGDTVLTVESGILTAGLLGAGGSMEVTAVGRLDINVIGRSSIDIADEIGLRLVDDAPTRYGTYVASSPRNLRLQATGAGSVATVGLANVGDRISVFADSVIDTLLYDVTPGDGLRLVVAGHDGQRSE
ncbi:MAG: leukotoxin LktA family filamentous adhesin, partial [Rhodobacter sp.]|nr:leukotoxin LktA family filamentous adhesin [Rhodobacter sp.]